MYVLKKIISTVLVAALALPAFAGGAEAASTPSLLVDNASFAINSYLIDDLNYMKIRDLAAAVGCGIDYNAQTGQVVLVPNQANNVAA